MEDAGWRMPDVGLTPILNILHPASGILHATCSSSHPVSHVTTFIDFECLAASPGSEGKTRAAASHPVMLGALGCRADERVFRQSILDARLHGARVARAGLTAESLGAAVARLLVQSPDGPIVSWSNFDAQVVAAATDLAAHVKHRFAARHSNAIPTADKWRRLVRPSIQLPLNNRGAAVNELKPYVRHLGIRTPPALTPGRPAFWARYVLGRLAKADGRYRRLEPRAKRAWHKLLEYNRLDCEGLREVHERATRELALWDSYRRTTFTVHGTPPIAIRIGWNPRPLRRLLARHNCGEWTFVTAWNPASVPLTDAENARRNTALRAELERRWTALAGVGAGEDASWTPEESFLVLGIPRAAAVAIGRKYGQLAIVHGTSHTAAELVPCEPRITRP